MQRLLISRVSSRRLQAVRGYGKCPQEPLDFSNTEKAFSFKSFGELCRHYFVFKLFSYDVLVNNSTKVMYWSERVLGRRVFEWIMKRSVYGQFVGGDDLASLRPTVDRLSKAGINSILDYAVEEDVQDNQSVVMETRSVSEGSPLVTQDSQFKPTVSLGQTTKTASARTYFYAGNDCCEQNKEHFLSCIATAADVSEHGTAFAAIKLTGLGRVEFLLRLSEAVLKSEETFLKLAGSRDILKANISKRSFQKGMREFEVGLSEGEIDQLFIEVDTDKSGRLSYQEWSNHFQPGSSLHRLINSGKDSLSVFNDDEVNQMKDVVRRARELADCAIERGVRLMVDAEQTYFQPAIRHIVVNILMPEYNLKEEPVIYNTIQCYLKDAERTLLMDLALSDVSGFSYGVKLVRGAYMNQEREKAKDEGYQDPIWPDKNATDDCYNSLVAMLIQRAKLGSAHVMVASHNKDSIAAATKCMKESGLDVSSQCVVFGQLLGMCDHITYPLGLSGYRAYKYVPYGPVSEVIPYLVRRAHENSAFMAGASQERELVWTEIVRRIFRMRL